MGEKWLVWEWGKVAQPSVSPDGTLCASGGNDGVTLIWDLVEGKKWGSSLEFGGIIHALCFSPNRYWLCAATEEGVKIWDLESQSCVQNLKLEPESGKNKRFYCSSMNWVHKWRH
ncbi:hypothetical protein MKW92_027832 [Papaver armeniacum]|nr:hypothetical protein MKW92_027832 [Papaver armeniacum]